MLRQSVRLFGVSCLQHPTIALSDVGHCHTSDATAGNHLAVLILAVERPCNVPNAIAQRGREGPFRLDLFLAVDLRKCSFSKLYGSGFVRNSDRRCIVRLLRRDTHRNAH